MLSAATVKMRFAGDTWSLRYQFIQCGIPRRYEDSKGQVIPSTTSQEKKKNNDYVRQITSINVSEDIPIKFLNFLSEPPSTKARW